MRGQCHWDTVLTPLRRRRWGFTLWPAVVAATSPHDHTTTRNRHLYYTNRPNSAGRLHAVLGGVALVPERLPYQGYVS
jgi:hypothetical protein